MIAVSSIATGVSLNEMSSGIAGVRYSIATGSMKNDGWTSCGQTHHRPSVTTNGSTIASCRHRRGRRHPIAMSCGRIACFEID